MHMPPRRHLDGPVMAERGILEQLRPAATLPIPQVISNEPSLCLLLLDFTYNPPAREADPPDGHSVGHETLIVAGRSFQSDRFCEASFDDFISDL